MSGQFQHNDQQVNNTFVGNNGYFAQSYDVMQTAIDKRTVTGSEFTLRHIIDYNRDTNLGDQFAGGNWDTMLEASVRTRCSKAAASNSTGSLVREASRAFTTASWWREFARTSAWPISRSACAITSQTSRMPTGTSISPTAIWTSRSRPATRRWKPGARSRPSMRAEKCDADKEAQAREQYFRFQEDVQNALAGQPGEATHTANGTTAGVFRRFRASRSPSAACGC